MLSKNVNSGVFINYLDRYDMSINTVRLRWQRGVTKDINELKEKGEKWYIIMDTKTGLAFVRDSRKLNNDRYIPLVSSIKFPCWCSVTRKNLEGYIEHLKTVF